MNRRPLARQSLRRLGAAAALGLALVGGATRVAHANPYESFIDIENDDDLYDLLASQQISQDTFDTLLDLLGRGVDLNRATREDLYTLPNLTYPEVDQILAYRKEHGFINDPADLVGAGVLSQDKLLSISAFLVVSQRQNTPLGAHGWVRAITRGTYTDRDVPPLAIRARANIGHYVTVGLAALSYTHRLGDVVWDPNRNAFLASDDALPVAAAKGYVRYENEKIAAIAGSYRAGFGQRLVFDNSSDYTPNGIYLDDQIFYDTDLTLACKESDGEIEALCERGRYVTPDFRSPDGLLGAAVGAKKLPVGSGYLQAYGWASYSPRSIYQYELVNRDVCPDVRDDSNPNCAAPAVFHRRSDDPLTPTDKFSFQTLPNMFVEELGGANVTYFADRRNSFGFTGYVANEKFLAEGADLDFQEWSHYPTGKKFGAIGANAAFGRGWYDVFIEAAQSFDKVPEGPDSKGGGGPAVIVRATATKKKQELEASFRYLSTDFVNPYAHPISAPDEFEGQRARDEVGGRLRLTKLTKRYSLRSAVDVWGNLTDDALKFDAYVRTDVLAQKGLWWGLWLEYEDKDLQEGGHDQCFAIVTEFDENGEPISCNGKKLTTIARLRTDLDRKTSLTVQLQHDLLDDNVKYDDKYRQDISAWLIALYRPNKDMRIRGRIRYENEAFNQPSDPDVEANEYLEQSVSMSGDVGMAVRQKDHVRVRLDTKFWLDDRASTQERDPNPEVSLWLSYEAKF